MCGKSKICLHENAHINVESKLTTFQKFIKHLIECEEIIPVEGNSNYTKQTKETFMKIARSFVSSSDFSASSDTLKKEKMIYLFLKRACLADHFLLDFDRILLVSNLSEYFSIKLDCLINEFENILYYA